MLVSVIVPCYNQGKYLNESLASVFNQTYSDWECIIVDDGSTDNSNVVAKNWVDKDKRFKYFYKDNTGVSSARNYGIRKATGDYLQFLDSDDLLDKTKIEISLNLLDLPENDNVKIVVSNFKTISEDSKIVSPPFCELNESLLTLNGFLFQWNVTFSLQIQCGFFDAKLFTNINFPENLSAQEDWVVWVQLLKTNENVVFIDKPLAYYRNNPSSRMKTMGISDNHTKVLDSFSTILSYQEYHKLSKHLLKNSYNYAITFKRNLKVVKKSNSYQSGLMIKKILKNIRLLKPARVIFKMILKLKAK